MALAVVMMAVEVVTKWCIVDDFSGNLEMRPLIVCTQQAGTQEGHAHMEHDLARSRWIDKSLCFYM